MSKQGVWYRVGGWALAVAVTASATAGAWRDDFSQGISDWEIFNLDRAVEWWEGKNGQASGEIFSPNFYSLLILSPKSSDARKWSNYTLRCRAQALRIRERDGEPRIGVSLYDQEFEGNRYLCLLAFNTNEIHLVRVTQDFWQVIPIAYPLAKERWYTLAATIRTEAQQETLTFAVNDDFRITIQATNPLKAGKIGLVVSDARGTFDDVEVEGDNVPSGGPGKPRAVNARSALATQWATLKTNP